MSSKEKKNLNYYDFETLINKNKYKIFGNRSSYYISSISSILLIIIFILMLISSIIGLVFSIIVTVKIKNPIKDTDTGLITTIIYFIISILFSFLSLILIIVSFVIEKKANLNFLFDRKSQLNKTVCKFEEAELSYEDIVAKFTPKGLQKLEYFKYYMTSIIPIILLIYASSLLMFFTNSFSFDNYYGYEIPFFINYSLLLALLLIISILTSLYKRNSLNNFYKILVLEMTKIKNTGLINSIFS